LPVKFHHQTSYLLHALSAVNMKSQFDIYFISGKVFLNKMCSKLIQNFKYSGPVDKVRFRFTKHTYISAGIFW
jgi:predicted choloylglycine hydrolase